MRVFPQKLCTTRFTLFYRIAKGLEGPHFVTKHCFSNGPETQRALGPHSGRYPRRTHTCGALGVKDVGHDVVLTGWLMPERKISKSLSFYTLKDSYGVTQLVAAGRQHLESDLLELMRGIPTESSVVIEGKVKARPPLACRDESTGRVEVQVEHVRVLNPADRDLPFNPSDMQNLANEDLRLNYRYLDLRRDELSRNLRKRSKVAHVTRNFLHDEDFVEVETPILLRSSPEGAREFLVPARSDGRGATFYALPQSPQQPKQLLICSGGIDKYYQIARCFRDEDGRKDRQPEFTQIDLEMAYVSWGSAGTDRSAWRIGGGEVRHTVETLLKRIWREVEGVILEGAFPVMTYIEAMSRYGTDKPDTRFPLEIIDLGSMMPITLNKREHCVDAMIVRKTTDSVFHSAAERMISTDSENVEKVVINPTNLTTWTAEARMLGFQNLSISTQLQLEPGDVIWLGKRETHLRGASTPLGLIRLSVAEMAQKLGYYVPTEVPHLLWITEFPLFTRADEDKEFLARGRWSSSHHPFTAPMWQDLENFWNGNFAEVRGQHYDLVFNGVEIGGGSVRIHDSKMQDYVFSQILQLSEAERSSFKHLLHALRCGAPPHGGMAIGKQNNVARELLTYHKSGFDRLIALLCNTPSIRDVIAFPKTGGGVDPLLKSPSRMDDEVLKQYGLQSMQRS